MTEEKTAQDSGKIESSEVSWEKVDNQNASIDYSDMTPEELQKKAKEMDDLAKQMKQAKKEHLRKKNLIEKERDQLVSLTEVDERIEEARSKRWIENDFKTNYWEESWKKVENYLETNPNVTHQQAAQIVAFQLQQAQPKSSEPLWFGNKVPESLVTEKPIEWEELERRAREQFRDLARGFNL